MTEAAAPRPIDAWLASPPVHDPRVAACLREDYDLETLARVRAQLDERGVFRLAPMPSGLHAVEAQGDASGSPRVAQVRDNVQVANVAWELGDVPGAQSTARALLGWCAVQAPRFEACIEGRAEPADGMQRPHVRFDGLRLAELDEPWPHAQNDALGQALWFLARATLAGLLPADDATATVLRRFPRYLLAIAYWRDADAGPWVEAPRVRASSLGAAVAGLDALGRLAQARERREPGSGERWTGGLDLARLAEHGRLSLRALLPWESRGGGGEREREVDAAQLFLVQPLRVVDEVTAARLVERVTARLLAREGVLRHAGERVPSRLFDPLLSTIHGWEAMRTRDPQARRRQVQHFNRALAQLGAPEEPGDAGSDAERGQPDGDAPRVWIQALLAQSLLAMERTLALEAAAGAGG